MSFNFECTIIFPPNGTAAQRVHMNQWAELFICGRECREWCMAERFELIFKIISHFDYLSQHTHVLMKKKKRSFFSAFIWIMKHVEIHFWWNMLLVVLLKFKFSWYLSRLLLHSSTSLPMRNVIRSLLHIFKKSKTYYLWKRQRQRLNQDHFSLVLLSDEWKICPENEIILKLSTNANHFYRINLDFFFLQQKFKISTCL